MNHLENERGETIIPVGQDGSAARMSTKYPDTIIHLIKAWKNNEPLLRQFQIVEECNVQLEDVSPLLRAAKYYVENNINPLVS